MGQKEIKLAESILPLLGGAENISSLGHCMTRLRVGVKDSSKVELDKLKALTGVMGVVEASGQYQIILGPGTVNRVSEHLSKVTGKTSAEVEDPEAFAADRKNNPLRFFLRKLANIFVPLIPAIVAGGMISGLTNVIIYSFDVKESAIISLLQVISKVIFFYLAIFVGINTAKEFGGTPALGGVAGGLIYLPDLEKITLFGDALIPGRGGLIGVLLAAWFITIVERYVRRFVHKSIDIIVTPTIAVLVTGLVTYFALQPIGGFISDGITKGLLFLLDQGGILAGAVLAGTFLPLVVTGLHQGLTPIHLELLQQTKLDPLLPILAMAGAGQVGAAIAVYIKTKNRTLRNVIKGSLPVGILGIGEPLIFGVTLPLGRPFLTACLGAAVGGAFQAVFKIASIAIGVSGIPLALLIKPGQILMYLLGVLISYAAGFAFTYFFGFKEEMAKNFAPDVPEGTGVKM
ncbi:PTS transporter subunit EIIC [Paenactinomyces guangxiensis]|uniref:PTS transporter subunit EIIC n=1 Tax=Paenactinomyces guangxiensis TaxID=1490290 RepID=A0A7W2A8E3_9BACL|nr:PTS transporter subunit EIIC [Paenactinomyces guangxiensis]MBA4494072.1 PTS transporter subunit EIIC [Paenactinomyces guangxiensis]MBH8591183.1 PTS transporter subunit EIIC [Paenactinomyces guangxiensis]